MICETVKARIDELNMPVVDVAQVSGVDRVTIDRFLRGTQSLGSDRLERVLDALGLKVAVAGTRRTGPTGSGK